MDKKNFLLKELIFWGRLQKVLAFFRIWLIKAHKFCINQWMVFVNVMKIGLFGFQTLRQTDSYTAWHCTTINTKQTHSFVFRKTASDKRPGEYKKNKNIYTFYPSKIMKIICTWKKLVCNHYFSVYCTMVIYKNKQFTHYKI